MSGGLSPRGKVAILSSREREVVCAPSSRREKIPGNPGTLGLGAVAATPTMVSHIQCTGVRAMAVWNVCAGEVGMAGVDAGGNASLLLGIPVAPAWQTYVGARLYAAPFFAPCWEDVTLGPLGPVRAQRRTSARLCFQGSGQVDQTLRLASPSPLLLLETLASPPIHPPPVIPCLLSRIFPLSILSLPLIFLP